jgi:hypothetical protein
VPRSAKQRHHRSYYGVTVHGQGKTGEWATERFILIRHGSPNDVMVGGNLSTTGKKMFHAKHPDKLPKATFEDGPYTRKEAFKDKDYAQAYMETADTANPDYSATNMSAWKVEPVEVKGKRGRPFRRTMDPKRKR